MNNDKVIERISEYIDTCSQDMIDLQGKLVSIPAVGPLNGGNGENEKAAYILSYLKEIGLDDLEEFNAPDSSITSGFRPNIACRIKGTSEGQPTFWIMPHMDVVPPGDAGLWNSDPFQMKIDGNKLIGRGTEDNHQGLVAAIFAFKSIKALGLKTPGDIGILLLSDEETASKYGVDYILDETGLIQRSDLILVPDCGDKEGSMIEIAEKSILWLKFTVNGKQCHGSMPSLGINSLRASSDLVLKFEGLYNKFDLKNPLFDPPFSTFEPTKSEENVQNVNTIPGRNIFYMDSRVLPEYDLKTVKEEIRRISRGVEDRWGVNIDMDIDQEFQAAPPTDPDSEIVRVMKRAIKSVYGLEGRPMGIGGGTVAAHIRERGYNAVVWSKIEHTAHQPNEYCLVKNMTGDAKVMTAALLGI